MLKFKKVPSKWGHKWLHAWVWKHDVTIPQKERHIYNILPLQTSRNLYVIWHLLPQLHQSSQVTWNEAANMCQWHQHRGRVNYLSVSVCRLSFALIRMFGVCLFSKKALLTWNWLNRQRNTCAIINKGMHDLQLRGVWVTNHLFIYSGSSRKMA